ncbi:hypothetical protein TIFTF001_024274 [Ficus carica]|uniref:Plant heme peroxidase family profile domain-containing protein n=1 Tax=Ficus carica TaxID=3494 RepID=A0AA88DGS7_FICCA|nr:hypothetical protein TIFTF001_024274 [Ficus carica]
MDHLGSVVTLCLIFCHVLKSGVEGQGGVLSYDFYEKSCPQVENIIRTGLQPIFFADLTSPAAFLRLMFHECKFSDQEATMFALSITMPFFFLPPLELMRCFGFSRTN